ncbi:TetR/AcrR family transcriptional regulator [Cupriavidus basilensis]|uniref:TetR/AcrR family transcriptional regulator n=1 Tax=Cupriavidus basilensis TaxID=68895 RepID=A0ABT6B087_9BURK|nr:TetR/AcrR family transcriptional regulator [Cupriavidus basilensis]MDF3838292.1 TetR/AcrR family transcriptional regulator [Cupriavidus basilensis]
MSEASKRLKNPELIRTQCLSVVRDLLVSDGPESVTLDLVAQRAGVSKGGLQYHYRSKNALLEALCEQLFEEFDSRYQRALSAEPDGPGKHARAYIRTCFDSTSPNNAIGTQRAIAMLALTLPSCRQGWSQRMRDAIAHDPADTTAEDRLLICRLAGDGMWYAEMFEVYDVDAPRKARLLASLLAMCDRATH